MILRGNPLPAEGGAAETADWNHHLMQTMVGKAYAAIKARRCSVGTCAPMQLKNNTDASDEFARG
jgi:hypothetical protein